MVQQQLEQMAGGDKKLYTLARRIAIKSPDIRLVKFPSARISPEVARQQLLVCYGMTEQLLVRVAEQVKSLGPAASNQQQEQQSESEEDE